MKTFIGLGLTNLRRNLGQSALAIVAMALAAAILSANLTLSRGYPADKDLPARRIIGGDLLVRAGRYVFAKASLAGAGDLEPFTWGPDDVGTSLVLDRELYTHGVLRAKGGNGPWFDPWPVVEALSSEPHVLGVHPVYALPALEVRTDPRRPGLEFGAASMVRGVDPTAAAVDPAPAENFGALITAGRDLSPCDNGRFVALIDSGREAYAHPVLSGTLVNPGVGKVLRLEFPSLTVRDGRPSFDYSRSKVYEFTVVGLFSARAKAIQAGPGGPGGQGGAGGQGQPGGDSSGGGETEWAGPTPFVYIPRTTLEAIYAELGGSGPMPVTEVAVTVDSIARLEELSESLRAAVPGFTVSTAIEEAARAQGQAVGGRVALPIQVGTLMMVLVYLLAATLIAVNQTTIVAGRRREIGILRAIGARGIDVILMILAESAAISLFGALCGYLSVYPLAIWNLVSRHTDLLGVILRVVVDAWRVIGGALALGLVFGLIPAVRAAGLTPQEVLRND